MPLGGKQKEKARCKDSRPESYWTVKYAHSCTDRGESPSPGTGAGVGEGDVTEYKIGEKTSQTISYTNRQSNR